jgi:hypothetical protein
VLEGTGSSVLCWVLLATQYVKELGANQVFGYNIKTVVDDLINAFKGKTITTTLAIANGVADGKQLPTRATPVIMRLRPAWPWWMTPKASNSFL